MHMESITLPRLNNFNEGSTTRHLKKVKEVVGKTRAATGQGSVESSARADRVESVARWSRVEKEGDGLRERKERDSRRHMVGTMLVKLRMNRAGAGCIEKMIYVSTFIF
jgi:hypothetical protein